MYLVYCYRNKINNKKYIGITKRSMKARERNHLSEAYNENNDKYNTPFKQAIRKYGIENFENIILEEDISTLEEANEREKYYINLYNTYCYKTNSQGYNATLGGDGVSSPKNPILKVDSHSGEVLAEYDCIATAEKDNKIGHISECAYNRLPTAGGYE